MYQGRCYCGEISWSTTGKVDFTSMCHCKDCQTVAGSAFGTTSLMIYDPDGVRFEGEEPKVFRATSEQGNSTQRGFCGTCGSVLFNHVSEGKPDEHWAMRTGGLVGGSPKMDKELFLKSKPLWVPKILSDGSAFEAMPK